MHQATQNPAIAGKTPTHDQIVAARNPTTIVPGSQAKGTLPFDMVPYSDLLAPGASKTVPIAGNQFYVFASSGPVTIQPGGGPAINYPQGTGWTPGVFTQLQVSNLTGSPLSFTINVSFTEFIDKRLIIATGSALTFKDSPTENLGHGLVTLLGGLEVAFPGTTGTQQRKQIVFRNPDPANDLQILDNSQRIFDILKHGDPPWTIESSDLFYIFNPNVGAVGFYAGETYYQ